MDDGVRESDDEFIYRSLAKHLTHALDELVSAVLAGKVSAGDIAKARRMLPKGSVNAFAEKDRHV